MSKKIIAFLTTLSLVIMLSGCTLNIDTDSKANKNQGTTPQLNQIRNICELATLKCQFHNIAKSEKEPGQGPLHWLEKERKFWIEYDATVEISFDISKVKMKQDETNISITLPEPDLKSEIVPGSWTKDSYIVEPDQFAQKNPITMEDQTKAVDTAQKDMVEQVRNNSTLLNTAERQAEELITNYINQIGEATDTKYVITWNSAEDSNENGGQSDSSSD